MTRRPHAAKPPAARVETDASTERAARHVRFGWWLLLVSLVFGAVLEALHGFKLGFYLGTSSEARRLMWTLAHAHGTLLALVNILFGLASLRAGAAGPAGSRLASRCLFTASVLLPAGFLLGGTVLRATEPGLTVLLVPIGAVLLVAGVLVAARRS